MRALRIMSLCVFATLPLAAQFLSPEDTLRTPSQGEQGSPAYNPSAPSQPSPVINSSADGFFSDFAAYGRDKNVILTWHLVAGRAIDKRIQIYRFTEEPRVI